MSIVSRGVLIAQGSILTNRSAEGGPGKRYYGCEFVDEVETIALDRVKELFGAACANVQPFGLPGAARAPERETCIRALKLEKTLLDAADEMCGAMDAGVPATDACPKERNASA